MNGFIDGNLLLSESLRNVCPGAGISKILVVVAGNIYFMYDTWTIVNTAWSFGFSGYWPSADSSKELKILSCMSLDDKHYSLPRGMA